MINSLITHPSSVIAVSQKGTRLAYASSPYVYIVDIETSKQLGRYCVRGVVTTLAFGANDSCLLVVLHYGHLQILPLRENQGTVEVQTEDVVVVPGSEELCAHWVPLVCCSNDGNYAALSDEIGNYGIYSRKTHTMARYSQEFSTLARDYSPRAEFVCEDRGLLIWNGNSLHTLLWMKDLTF